MLLIGENIHVISKSVKEAILDKDEEFFKNLIEIQSNMDFIDLNAGPAKGDFAGSLAWLTGLVQEKNPEIGISFDTTNYDEMVSGFEKFKNKSHAFINSTSSDEDKFSKLSDLAVKNNCNIIALTLSKETGIPKTADGRLEIALDMYERFLEKGLDTDKIFFDPLVLPITVDQSQASEAINTIKMIKESFDPPVKTVVGLSNVSNGCPSDLRPLINRVYAVLAWGAGLDAAIIDAKDLELVRILKMLDADNPESNVDKLYKDLALMIENFEELDDVEYNKGSREETLIVKTAGIILNKNIYSDSFTQI